MSSSPELQRLTSGVRKIGERLDGLERAFNPQVILLKLDHLAEGIESVQASVDKINSRLSKTETAVSQHETRVQLLESFCHERVRPALDIIVENKTAIAVMIAKYGAIGLGAGGGATLILWLVAKALGYPGP